MQQKIKRGKCLSDTVKYFMVRKKITEAEVVSGCDAPDTIIRDIILGEMTNPSLEHVLMIVDALGTTAHDFFAIYDIVSELNNKQIEVLIGAESHDTQESESFAGGLNEDVKVEKFRIFPKGGRPAFTEQEEGIYALHEQGVTFDEIAKKYGVSSSQVSSICSRIIKANGKYDTDLLFRLLCDHTTKLHLVSRILTRLKYNNITTVEEFAEFNIYDPKMTRNLGDKCLEVMKSAQVSLRGKHGTE